MYLRSEWVGVVQLNAHWLIWGRLTYIRVYVIVIFRGYFSIKKENMSYSDSHNYPFPSFLYS